ncbi:alpha/beta fold hydrolase [Fructilactobacillus sp. Tb1]|uniref:alpha/beta fold hydrolase n=1 Tax=Fructilactobacillus sp. Tb1 TaxID=3422304 RepID=UPI003D2D913C
MDNNISYTSVGDGTPIIFLHGLSLDSHSTMNFFEPFSNSNYQRIYIDLPGMGQSSPVSSASSDEILKELLKFIHDLIGNKKFIVYGHSFGGYLALAITASLKSQVLGCFASSPVVIANHNHRNVAHHINKIIEEITPNDNQQFFTSFLSMDVMVDSNRWKTYQKSIIPGLLNANFDFINHLQKNYSLNNEDNLKNETGDVHILIIAGKYDQIVGYQDQINFAKNNQNAECIVINDAGHNLSIDQPEMVHRLFNDFLKQL